MATIKSFHDLFAYLGVGWNDSEPLKSNEARLSRRIYKDTACGAWAALVAPGVRKVGIRSQTWSAEYRQSILGPLLVRARQDGKPWRPAIEAPEAVRQYLCAGQPMSNGGLGVSREDWDTILSLCKQTRDGTYRWRGAIDVPVTKPHRGGVQFGSIIEGVDATVEGDVLFFPFQADEIDKQIESIEAEANTIWDDTHGCESCFGGGGDGSVDPDCPECHGQGVPI